MLLSDKLNNVILKSKELISQLEITKLIKNNKDIIEVSTISSILDIDFDLIITVLSEECFIKLNIDEITLSNGYIIKPKLIIYTYNDSKFKSSSSYINKDEWEEEQIKSNFGMGNDEYNKYNDSSPIFH